jgi:lipopolysaccharide/colanic/teichoic acid biosynthesis glycosyltransferase
MIRLFRVYVPASAVALLVSEVILTYTCYLAVAFTILEVDPQVFLLYDNGWMRISIVVACFMAGIYFHDLYAQFRIKSRVLLFQQMGVVVGIAFLMQALLSYLGQQDLVLPAWIMIGGSALALILLPAWRIFYSAMVLRAMGAERVLYLGASPMMQEIVQHVAEHPETGIAPLGYVDNPDPGVRIPGGKVLGGIADLVTIVSELKPDRFVVGMSVRQRRPLMNQLLEMGVSGMHIEDAMATYEATFRRISAPELRPAQLIFSTEFEPNQNRVTLQSMYSLAIAILATVIASPLMLLVAIVVKLSSPGPVLDRQQRVGKKDVPFTLYKFRSGRWLRRLRLDGLPLLFNVLKGDLSLVGPRPERPEFVAELEKRIPFYRQRHCVKPGIIGWAQIHRGSGGTVEDTIVKLEYDLYYIKNLAPALDAYILLHTIRAGLKLAPNT